LRGRLAIRGSAIAQAHRVFGFSGCHACAHIHAVSLLLLAGGSVSVYNLPRAKALQMGDLPDLIVVNSIEKAMRNVEWFTALKSEERLSIMRRHGKTLPASWSKDEVVVQVTAA
jgi:hypothetical protein